MTFKNHQRYYKKSDILDAKIYRMDVVILMKYFLNQMKNGPIFIKNMRQ